MKKNIKITVSVLIIIVVVIFAVAINDTKDTKNMKKNRAVIEKISPEQREKNTQINKLLFKAHIKMQNEDYQAALKYCNTVLLIDKNNKNAMSCQKISKLNLKKASSK